VSYLIYFIVHIFCHYTAAPAIDPPLSLAVTVVVGSSLTLSCTSRGSPPDIFTWRKDNSPIVQSTSIITVTHNNDSAVYLSEYSVENVNASNSGTYICTVINPIGSDRQTIHVTIVNGM